MTENRISKEAARAQIDAWLEYYGLDFADIVIEDGEAVANTLLNTLTRAIQRGELEISAGADLQVVQNLRTPVDECSQIVYLDKVANARIAMDRVPSKHANERMLAFMSALSGIPVPVLMKLRGSDSTVFNRVATVFSMV